MACSPQNYEIPHISTNISRCLEHPKAPGVAHGRLLLGQRKMGSLKLWTWTSPFRTCWWEAWFSTNAKLECCSLSRTRSMVRPSNPLRVEGCLKAPCRIVAIVACGRPSMKGANNHLQPVVPAGSRMINSSLGSGFCTSFGLQALKNPRHPQRWGWTHMRVAEFQASSSKLNDLNCQNYRHQWIHSQWPVVTIVKSPRNNWQKKVAR